MEVESPAATMSKSTAAHNALSTTELLEQILSHLGVEDLVLLRRVSRHWRNTMAGSLVLQRAMFLAHEPELPFEWHLQSLVLGQQWRNIQKTSVPARKPEGRVFQSSRFNPLLFERKVSYESEGDSEGQESTRLHARNGIFVAGGISLFAQMFIAQPPVTHALVAGTIPIELDKENGIRVLDIIGALRRSDGFPDGLHRNALSIVVPNVIFLSPGDEKRRLIVRPYRSERVVAIIRSSCTSRW